MGKNIQMIETKITPGIYEYYKGKRYEVMGVGLSEETQEPVVIYKALYENELSQLWVRSLSVFEENVSVDGKEVPRFSKVDVE